MFAKSVVKAGQSGLNPLYAELGKRTGQTPKWNFHKYLIDRSGTKVKSFGSSVEPNSSELLSAINALLAEPTP
jgi:glutathione peroxidase